MMMRETIDFRCDECGHRWQKEVPVTDGAAIVWDDLCPRCEAQGVVVDPVPSSYQVAPQV
jgi:hypothetical protein